MNWQNSKKKQKVTKSDTEIFAYSDTGHSDCLLTVTLLANPKFLRSVTLITYLLIVTLCPGPGSVTVRKYICSHKMKISQAMCFLYFFIVKVDKHDYLFLIRVFLINHTGCTSLSDL